MTYEEPCAGPPDDVDRPTDCEGTVTLEAEPKIGGDYGPPYGLVCDPCGEAAGVAVDELLETLNASMGES